MTPEKQRIAIAEACGWKNAPWEKPSTFGLLLAINPDGKQAFMPDYLNDLNAMHEAEKLNDMHFDQKWAENIVFVALRESSISLNRSGGWDWVLTVSRLSAAQRAEAFLRTIGKWEDDQ